MGSSSSRVVGGLQGECLIKGGVSGGALSRDYIKELSTCTVLKELKLTKLYIKW